MSAVPAPRPSVAPRRRRHTAWILAAIYLGAGLLALGIFLASRVVSRHRTFAQRTFFWTGDIHANAPMGLRMRPEARGLAVLAHGLESPARRISVRTDTHGYRIPVDGTPKPVGPGGIAAIGCSCTFAHGVAAESSYVVQAGEILGLPTANLGVCGYSAVTSLLLLQQDIATLRPRIVVYGFANFHLERSARSRADADLFQSYARCEGGICRVVPPRFDNQRTFAMQPQIEALYYEPRLAGESTPLDLRRLRALWPLAWQDLGRSLHPTSIALRYEQPALEDTAFCRWLLGELQQTCRAQDATLVLLWFPAAFGETITPAMAAAIADMQRAADFVYVDCSPRLFPGVRDQQEYAERWQVPRDGHPNRFMHLEMARALAAALGLPPAAASGP